LCYRRLRDIACRADVGSSCFSTGFGECEPLVAEVGDDLQAPAEGFDVGGQSAQFGGAWLVLRQQIGGFISAPAVC